MRRRVHRGRLIGHVAQQAAHVVPAAYRSIVAAVRVGAAAEVVAESRVYRVDAVLRPDVLPLPALAPVLTLVAISAHFAIVIGRAAVRPLAQDAGGSGGRWRKVRDSGRRRHRVGRGRMLESLARQAAKLVVAPRGRVAAVAVGKAAPLGAVGQVRVDGVDAALAAKIAVLQALLPLAVARLERVAEGAAHTGRV